MAGGRPSKYSLQLAEKICEKIASSNLGLTKICEDEDFPNRITIHNWLKEHEEFLNMYTRAKEDQADFLADEILEIADKALLGITTVDKPLGVETTEADNVQRSRLMIESRKWLAMKLKPRKYGDKMDVTTNGEKITTFNVGFKKPDDTED